MPKNEGAASARAALAGNPSDGYGGAVLAVTLPELTARASAVPSTELRIDPPSQLVEATARRYARELDRSAINTEIKWHTTIPRAVGLGGSSAIVIAVLRALGCALAPDDLASLALAIEVEELGITAGLQDRVAQAYGGLTFMDFASRRYEPLDRGLLPPLVIAWHAGAAEDSSVVHADLRARFDAGDTRLAAAMLDLAAHARNARDALLAGDLDQFGRCLDASFDLRVGIVSLDPKHVAMIELARSRGARANYTGSGGAIVAACRDLEHQASLHAALQAAGCGVTTA
jgi:galactokinase/mevalonate kinase-like predicted kinase